MSPFFDVWPLSFFKALLFSLLSLFMCALRSPIAMCEEIWLISVDCFDVVGVWHPLVFFVDEDEVGQPFNCFIADVGV